MKIIRSIHATLFVCLLPGISLADNLCNIDCNFSIGFPDGGYIKAKDPLILRFGVGSVIDLGVDGSVESIYSTAPTDASAGGAILLASGESVRFGSGGFLNVIDGNLDYSDMEISTNGAMLVGSEESTVDADYNNLIEREGAFSIPGIPGISEMPYDGFLPGLTVYLYAIDFIGTNNLYVFADEVFIGGIIEQVDREVVADLTTFIYFFIHSNSESPRVVSSTDGLLIVDAIYIETAPIFGVPASYLFITANSDAYDAKRDCEYALAGSVPDSTLFDFINIDAVIDGGQDSCVRKSSTGADASGGASLWWILMVAFLLACYRYHARFDIRKCCISSNSK